MKFLVGVYIVLSVMLLGTKSISQEVSPNGAITIDMAKVVEAQSIELETKEFKEKIDLTTPPSWLADTMEMVAKMPIIGPIVIEILKWLGVIGAIGTAFVTFLLASVRALYYAGKIGKLAGLMAWAIAFEQGKVMNWFKFFSLYNAKEIEKKEQT